MNSKADTSGTMQTYIATFKGIYLAGFALVKAENKKEARLKIKQYLSEQKFSRNTDCTLEIIPDQEGVYPIWNGDY